MLTSSAHKAATRMYAACMQVCLHKSSHFSAVSKAEVLNSGHACCGMQKNRRETDQPADRQSATTVRITKGRVRKRLLPGRRKQRFSGIR